jgi:predicted porin
MNSLRVDNAIAYVSPTFAGFKGGVGYSTRIDGAETTPSDSNTSALFMGAQWASGPFFVALTYDVVNQATATPSRPDQKHLQVGGTFDIGPVRLHAAYADQTNIGAISSLTGGTGSFITLPAGIANFDANAYLGGVTWTITPAIKVFGSFQMFDASSKPLTATTSFEPDFNIWAIGGTYNLSRRTNLYASYASRDADGTLVGNSFNAKQLAIGIRHLF